MKTTTLIFICFLLINSSCKSQSHIVSKLEKSMLESKDIVDSSRISLLNHLRLELFKKLKSKNISEEFILLENLSLVGFSYDGIIYSKSKAYLFSKSGTSTLELNEISKEEVLNRKNSISSCALNEVLNGNLSSLLIENEARIETHSTFYLTISKEKETKFNLLKSLCFVDANGKTFWGVD